METEKWHIVRLVAAVAVVILLVVDPQLGAVLRDRLCDAPRREEPAPPLPEW